MHIPVLSKETIEYLRITPGEKYIDATFGSGGHSIEIVRAGGKVLGIDRDPENVKTSRPGIDIALGNFSEISAIATENRFSEVSGILFDLGISSEQLDDPKRGFSFQKDGPLDMRMNVEKSKERNSKSETAADIVNFSSEKELVKIFYEFGEERRFGKRVARVIMDARKLGSIETTAQLFDIIKRSLPSNLRFRAGDTARRIFQAIRIAVNKELENLKLALPAALGLLKPGGRLVVISFHSLEDRIVKDFMHSEAADCVCPPEFPECRCDHRTRLKVLTRKPVTAGLEEVGANPRSKSAKLRCAEKV